MDSSPEWTVPLYAGLGYPAMKGVNKLLKAKPTSNDTGRQGLTDNGFWAKTKYMKKYKPNNWQKEEKNNHNKNKQY